MYFTYAMWRNDKLEHAYSQVAKGDSEIQVLKLLGKPYCVTGKPQNIVWDSDWSIKTNNGVCIRETWYTPSFSIEGDWKIGFDRSSNVVSKYHYISP